MLLETPIRMEYTHVPVLSAEVLAQFDLGEPAWVVDGTLGLGGHSEALLERYPTLSVLGVEWDAQALAQARERLAPFGPRFRAIEGSYADLPALLEREALGQVGGILIDLGVSSLQLDDPARGFSFMRPGPFDMRMSKTNPTTAWDILQRSDVADLARLFRVYGEEPFAGPIARTLKGALESGQLTNDTFAVAQCIRAAVPIGRGRIDPATRCFQAFRMVVNHELENLESLLNAAPQLLAPGGRLAVIAFHSLEDRMVKQHFQQAAKGCICPPQIPQCVCGRSPWGLLRTKKAVQASDSERSANPRARSARLRVLEKLS
jgi:16S rRNA (cytosine1402-N4)-methyltransferase